MVYVLPLQRLCSTLLFPLFHVFKIILKNTNLSTLELFDNIFNSSMVSYKKKVTLTPNCIGDL